jgi:NADH dehydrogenase (ubiquinone) 1 alpha subcomplex subunit 9
VSRNFRFDDVHVTGAERIARICAENGVPRLVHVSHLNADINSPSAFYRSKAKGEEAVKAVFPEAIIVRPGPMYGQEDKLLNNMACVFRFGSVLTVHLCYPTAWPVLWKFNGGQTKIRPVWVGSPFISRIKKLSSYPGARHSASNGKYYPRP